MTEGAIFGGSEFTRGADAKNHTEYKEYRQT
jgi:hypothetical protein